MSKEHNVQATKLDAEKEYRIERKQKMRELTQKQNDIKSNQILLYSDRARRISEHPILKNITIPKDYKKISKKLLKDSLTTDVFSEDYIKNFNTDDILNSKKNNIKVNNSTVSNNTDITNNDINTDKENNDDYSTKYLKINFGDGESVIMSPEQRDDYIKLHKEWLKIHSSYLSDKELERYKSDLQNFLNLKPGSELTITSKNYNNNRLLFYKSYSNNNKSKKTTKKDSEEENLNTLFLKEIGDAYYGGHTFSGELDGKHSLYTRDEKIQQIKEILKKLHPELTDIDNLDEKSLLLNLAKLGYDYNLIQRYIYNPTTNNPDTTTTSTDPFNPIVDETGLYDGYNLVDHGDIFKDLGFHIIQDNNGKIFLASINKDADGKYTPIEQQLLTGADQYNTSLIKDGYMLFTDADGNYRFGKIGSDGYTDNDHLAIMNYINTWRDKLLNHTYKIGDQTNYNYALEDLFSNLTGNRKWGDVTYMLPKLIDGKFGNFEGYRALLLDASTVGEYGSFNNTPIVLYNPVSHDKKTIYVTSLDNKKIQITDESGNSAEYDVPSYSPNEIDYSWYENYNDFITEDPFHDPNRSLLPGINDKFITGAGDLWNSGAFESGWDRQSAITNDPSYYAKDDEKIKTIILSALDKLNIKDLDDEDWQRYANFTRLVIKKAGGVKKLRELGYNAETISSLLNLLALFLLNPVSVLSQKNGGILKAARGTNLNLLDTQENIALRESEYLNKLQLHQNQVTEVPKEEKKTRLWGDSRDQKEWDLTSTLDALAIGADAIAAAGSFIPLAGPAVSLIAGGLGTAIQLGADLSSDEDRNVWANLGTNLAFTVLGMIPGLKTVKLAKGAAKANKILDAAGTAIKTASKTVDGPNKYLYKKLYNRAEKIINEGKEVIKNKGLIERTFRSIGNGTKKVITTTGKYGYPVLLFGNVVNSTMAIGSAINDIADGKGIALEDLRGVVGATLAVSGLKSSLHKFAIDRITTPVKLTSKSNKLNTKNTLSVRLSNKNNDTQIELDVTPGMKKLDVDIAASTELKRLKNETSNSINVLTAKQNSGTKLTAEELNELTNLLTKLETYEDLLKVPKGLTDRSHKLKIHYDKKQLNNLNKNLTEVDDNTTTLIKSEKLLEEEGLGKFEKYAEKVAKKYGYRQITPELDKKLNKISSKANKTVKKLTTKKSTTTSKSTKPNTESVSENDGNIPVKYISQVPLNPNKYKSAQIKMPMINSETEFDFVHPSHRMKKVGNKYIFLKLGGIAQKIHKYSPGDSIRKTHGDLILTIADWRQKYNDALIEFYELLSNGETWTPEKIEQFNKLFTDYNTLLEQIKYDPSAKRSIEDESGLTRQYLLDFNGLGLHLNSFKLGWEKGYNNPSLTTSEVFNENGEFKADDYFGNRTYNRLANLWNDEELERVNKAIEQSGYQWTLMDDKEVADENGRRHYKITPIAKPNSETPEEVDDEVDEVDKIDEIDEIDTDTDLQKDKIKRRRLDLTPLKVGADLVAQHIHNKRQLELGYVKPFHKPYINLNNKVTDNYTALIANDRAKGAMNTLAEYLTSNFSDIDKINSLKTGVATQNATNDIDTAYKRDNEYEKTSDILRGQKEKEMMYNTGVATENNKSDYSSNLLNKQNLMGANEAMFTTLKDGVARILKSVESNKLADLYDYNQNLIADLLYDQILSKKHIYDKYKQKINDEKSRLTDLYNTYLNEFNNDPANTGKEPLPFDLAINPETGNTFEYDLSDFEDRNTEYYNSEMALLDTGYYKKRINLSKPFVNVFTHTFKKGGNLTFQEKKELIKIKSRYDILKEQTKDIQKTLDRNMDSLNRIMSGLSKERLLILKNMLK